MFRQQCGSHTMLGSHDKHSVELKLLARQVVVPGHCSHTSQQFVHTKRFREIVVSTQVQPMNRILVLATNGHDDDRDARKLANPLAHHKGIQLGHHDIGDDQIEHVASLWSRVR
jgi:hypothetical protein